MAGVRRVDRLRDQIKEFVSEIIQSKLKDPHIGMVTIIDVKLTSDLRQATVFYSVYGDALKRKMTNKTLEKAKGFIQSELARKLQIRKAPLLELKIDQSTERALRIEQLLEQIQREDEKPPENPE